MKSKGTDKTRKGRLEQIFLPVDKAQYFLIADYEICYMLKWSFSLGVFISDK